MSDVYTEVVLGAHESLINPLCEPIHPKAITQTIKPEDIKKSYIDFPHSQELATF